MNTTHKPKRREIIVDDCVSFFTAIATRMEKTDVAAAAVVHRGIGYALHFLADELEKEGGEAEGGKQ